MLASAGVIPVRSGRVFLLERSPSLRFLPGFHAFPGGVLEDCDLATVVENGDELAACAARELLEEVGLLPDRSASPELRRAVLERSAVLERLDASRFLKAGVRITPPYTPRRFRTQFFLLELTDEEEPEVWPGEASGGRWWGVEEALQAWREGSIFLVAPTLSALQALLRLSPREAAALLEGMPHGTGIPGPTVPLSPVLRCLTQESSTLPPARTTMTCLAGPVLVDPGSALPGELERLRQALDEFPVQEVLLTHHHPDHVAGALAVRSWGLPLAAHPETARQLSFAVDRTVEEGERWGDWVALHTPGHARGHLCLWHEERGLLLAGDLTAGHGTILIDPEDGGDMAVYLASLERMRALKPRLVVSAHGPPFGPGSDLPGKLLAHRLERERKVLEALPGSLTELLERAYADVQGPALELARRSLLAHLLKLEREGRAFQEGSAWKIRA
ncbi:MAG: hypothetical protein AMXMBFR33_24140 [Candidatus Xenobia bacterium]